MDRRQAEVLSVRVRPELRAMLERRADTLGLRTCDLVRAALAEAAACDAGLQTIKPAPAPDCRREVGHAT